MEQKPFVSTAVASDFVYTCVGIDRLHVSQVA